MGELVKDSTFGYTARGNAFATFTLAFPSVPEKDVLSKREKGRINIIFFGAEAPKWSPLLKVGKQVVVEGKLQQRSWKTPEGIYKSRTEIIANQVECCDSSEGKREAHNIGF